MIRNPFERWTNSLPKPKVFGMPNQGISDNNRIFGTGMGSHQNFQNYQTPDPRSAPSQPRNDWGEYLNEMRDIYTKQGPAANAYSEHLNALPEFKSPGGWHKFGSALVGAAEGLRSGGASGWQAGQQALFSPYQRELENWGMKEQALGRATEQEDKASGRRLSFLKEVREVARDEEEAMKWLRDYDIKERQLEIDREHKEAQRQNWLDQGYRETTDVNGNTVFVNPRTGERRNFGASAKVKDWEYLNRQVSTGERNAATNARRTEIYAGDVTADNARADRTQERYEQPYIAPGEQSMARGSATNRAALENPSWNDFVDEEGNIDRRKAYENPTEFEKFMRRVTEIESGIFGRRRNMTPSGRGGQMPEIIY